MKLIDRLIQNSGFVINKPSVIKRLIKNYTLKFIFKKDVLRTVDIVLNYGCNLHCPHCYAVGFVDHRQPLLSLPEIFKTIDKCCAEGAIHFNLIGGEPTLNKDLFKLIDYINTKSALISLATNGIKIDLEYARQLKEHKVDVVLLSLDSIDENEHDQIRGKGSYEKAIRALDNCFKVKLKVYISTVLTSQNLHNGGMKALGDYCRKRKILLHVNLPALFGEWKGRNDLFLSEVDQEEIKKFYRGKNVRSCEMSAYGVCRCTSGKEKMHITAYGGVMPCTFIPISFGNIRNEDLGIIRERMRVFPLLNSHNELCIPPTNREYHQLMGDKLKDAELLPVNYKDLNKDSIHEKIVSAT